MAERTLLPFVKTDLPCPCGDSSRGFAVKANGFGRCFKCKKEFKDVNLNELATAQHSARKDSKPPYKAEKYQYLSNWNIPKEVFEFYGVKAGIGEDSTPLYIAFPYPNGRILKRGFTEKKFWWEGEKVDKDGLFGQNCFAPGSAKAITICEGAKDALSVYHMFDQKYPAVAVTSVSSAKKECSDSWEYLNSFDKIYICMDSDEVGQKAAEEIARLFDTNKVHMVQLTKKDPNEYLPNEVQKFVKEWWAAKRFIPEGILASYLEFDKVIDDDSEKPSIEWPWGRMQEMTYGIRNGELILLTAQEGIGKTEIFRALEYHILKTTDSNIGIIHLEENKARTLKGLVGYELQRPVHLPDWAVSKDELKSTLRKVTGRDERVHIYSHFGSDDPDVILSTIRFMAGSCGCKYVFLDHITMVVSGLAGEDERKALDYVSTRAAMMVEELDFTLFMISHVNDEGKTRGSRNIAKVADLRVDLYRDITAEDDFNRNTTHLTVAKNRFAGKTGPGGRLFFDPGTFMLTETTELPE